jgi:FKBP-type peptidyl-prolyl cis-trans isomerase SlyD
MPIKENSVVTMHYELKDATGDVLDSSKGQDPLVYLHGASNIIIGLEEQLEGKSIGDTINAVVEPEKGYGMPVEALVQQVPTSAFGEELDKVQVGMRFQAETEQGPVPVVVTAMENEIVTVDGNHPLAGKQLHFECSISEIRKASAEEIEHGHVHGAGGHQH